MTCSQSIGFGCFPISTFLAPGRRVFRRCHGRSLLEGLLYELWEATGSYYIDAKSIFLDLKRVWVISEVSSFIYASLKLYCTFYFEMENAWFCSNLEKEVSCRLTKLNLT